MPNCLLTYFIILVYFYTPTKHPETCSYLALSEGIERLSGMKWILSLRGCKKEHWLHWLPWLHSKHDMKIRCQSCSTINVSFFFPCQSDFLFFILYLSNAFLANKGNIVLGKYEKPKNFIPSIEQPNVHNQKQLEIPLSIKFCWLFAIIWFLFDGVRLKIYYGPQIQVNTGGFELRTPHKQCRYLTH